MVNVSLLCSQIGECGGEDEVEDPPEGGGEGDALGERPRRHQLQGAAKTDGMGKRSSRRSASKKWDVFIEFQSKWGFIQSPSPIPIRFA